MTTMPTIDPGRLQAVWDDLLARHRYCHGGKRRGHATLTDLGGRVQTYAALLNFPAREDPDTWGIADDRPVDAALTAVRVTPLLPEHVRFYTDGEGDAAFELLP
jgi:hypothetical protein